MRDVKGMVAGIYDRFGDLVDTAEATYKAVTYHPTDTRSPADDSWDFLDEDE